MTQGPDGLVGAVAAAECYVNSDIFGDRDEVVCVFSYAGKETHALVMVVDYNAGGMLRDGWVTSQVDKLLERCRDGVRTCSHCRHEVHLLGASCLDCRASHWCLVSWSGDWS